MEQRERKEAFGHGKRRIALGAAAVLGLLLLGYSWLGGIRGEAPSEEPAPALPSPEEVSEEPAQSRATVMIYMCAGELESRWGLASADLREMAGASISPEVKVLVAAGGSSVWQNGVISPGQNQIYQVETGGIRCLEENFGSGSLAEPEQLAAFIRYCAENYPARRNMLVLWGAGGGMLSGYGSDESAPESAMSLAGLRQALEQGGCFFEWIGLDASLMATAETAAACSGRGEYLLASQEMEPDAGWYYGGFLSALSQGEISSGELMRILADDFIDNRSVRARAALSVIDLEAFRREVLPALEALAESVPTLLEQDGGALLAGARAGAGEFSRSGQVDLADFAGRLGTPEALALREAAESCVLYRRSALDEGCGLSLSLPYEDLTEMVGRREVWESLGMEEYAAAAESFAGVLLRSRVVAGAGAVSPAARGEGSAQALLESYTASEPSPLRSLQGGVYNALGGTSAGYRITEEDRRELLEGFAALELPPELSWAAGEAETAAALAGRTLDPNRLTVTWKDGGRFLSLTEEEWSLVAKVEKEFYLRDSQGGYLCLGRETAEGELAGDLALNGDGTWFLLDGQTTACLPEAEAGDEEGEPPLACLPVVLNGEAAELQVRLDEQGNGGTVTGWHLPCGSPAGRRGRCGLPLETGDELLLCCGRYSYEGAWEENHALGGSIRLGEAGLELSRGRPEGVCMITYRITDIYGSPYWLPAWIA